jgi:hypothetical protein
MNPNAPVLLSLLAALYLTRAAASEASVAFLGPKASYSDEAGTDRTEPPGNDGGGRRCHEAALLRSSGE